MNKLAPTNVEKLSKVIESKGYEAAMPMSLDYQVLNQIVRDLRETELYEEGLGKPEPQMSGVMYLILHLMQGRMDTKGIDGNAFKISERSLHELIEMYQHFAERELVARAVGVRYESDSQEMLGAIDMQIAALQRSP